MANPLYLFSPAFKLPSLKIAMDDFQIKWLAKHEFLDPEDTLLYHYTTLNGLQGILKDRSLWFGHVSTLNDRLEIQYGKDLVRNIIQELIDKQSRKESKEFLQNILIQINAFGNVLFHTFISCFCKSSNLLSQWRAYANRGGGYCLGFKLSSSTRIASNIQKLDEGRILHLRKVVYDEKEQQQLVVGYLETVLAASMNALDGNETKRFSEMPTLPNSIMAIDSANILLDMIISFKHPAFKSEEEWRLVRVFAEHYQPEDLRFREATGELVPYRPTFIYDLNESDPPTFPLQYIGYGPILEPLRTRSAITLLLHSTASDGHTISLNPSSVMIKEAGYSLRL